MADEPTPVDIVTAKLPMIDPALRRAWAHEILSELHANGWRTVKTTQPYAYKHVIWDEWTPDDSSAPVDDAGVAAGPQATPDQVLWEGETSVPAFFPEFDEIDNSEVRTDAVPVPPGTRVRVVAVPTGDQEQT